MAFEIKLWGVRGSLPKPHTPAEIEKKIAQGIENFFEFGYSEPEQIHEFLKAYEPHLKGGYGGNTICVEARTPDNYLLIDGGSGIRKKAMELMKGPCAQGNGEVHILMTHFHWDHLIGFPFFIPLFIPGNQIHLYAVQKELPDVMKMLFKKPYFPVAYEELGASIHYHQLAPRKQVEINGFDVTPYQLDHPDPCWGFRIEKDGKVFSHCVDTECLRTTKEELGEDIGLYRDVDLMLFDAQYTVKETSEKVNWGHAAANFGLDIALREKINQVLFMHHDPSAPDERIRSIELEVEDYYNRIIEDYIRQREMPSKVDWNFAREDEVAKVG